jgi:hypothetical protein
VNDNDSIRQAELAAAYEDAAQRVEGFREQFTTEAALSMPPAWVKAAHTMFEYVAATIRARTPTDASVTQSKLIRDAEARGRKDGLKKAARAVANVEVGFHDGISGDWHNLPGPTIISEACASIRKIMYEETHG